MTPQELREKDAWVERVIFSRPDVKVENDCFGSISWDADKLPPRHYTTDPAAAMMVLEKCGVKISTIDGGNQIKIWQLPQPDFQPIWFISQSGNDSIFADASTLPLAICLFAQKLFNNTKEGR